MTWREILRTRPATPGAGHSPAGAETTTADTSATADVLLQVVLPIVLILAFFVLQSARQFEERLRETQTQSRQTANLGDAWRRVHEAERQLAAERRRLAELGRQADAKRAQLAGRAHQIAQEVEELARWWSGIEQSDKAELAEELSQALLEIQKQRIVAALETVESEYRQQLGLAFLQHKEIRLTGEGKLAADHEIFQRTCRATAEALRSEESRQREQARLYLRVLDAAGLTDGGPAGPDPAVEATRGVRDSLLARNGRITPQNREFLRSRLTQLLAELNREVRRLGSRVVEAALDHYRSSPLDDVYRRNPELLRLKQEIVRASREGRDTAPYEEALLSRLYQQIKADFDRQGYTLLPEVWREI